MSSKKITLFLITVLIVVFPLACEIDDLAGEDTESDEFSWRATIGGNGLLGTYYNNSDFTAKALTRVDPTVNYDWGEGSPDSKIGRNGFSVRWTGFVEARYSETYTFYTVSDDGVKLWVDDKLVISDWSDHAPRESSGKVGLTAGKRYSIKLEYYENGGGAVAKLLWSSPRQAKQTIPNTQLFVQAEGSTENVARGKNTSQSSTSAAGVSSRAVDGNTSGRWSDRSVTHTSNTSTPWWRVDLGSAYDVKSVSVFNRTDCCSDRLSDFHVDLLDKNGNVLAKKDFRGQADAKTDIMISAAGVHAVRVQLYGRDPLSLAEVQVWAGTDDGGGSLCAGANENSNATLSCSSGETISSIDFASYGLPTGLCGVGFEQGTCHASGSEAKVEASCLNKQTCTVRASNGTFGDPCPGKKKRLAVAYHCTGDDVDDQCPNDPNKTEPGECGCGTPEGSCGDRNYSKLVYPGSNGKLLYKPDEHGNIIPDFSYVGYKNSEQNIPNVPVVKTISPISGDNRNHIQNAINQVGTMSLKNGIRGALLLEKGEYKVDGQININKSGVVIRGEGNDENGTRVIATKRTKHDLFVLNGTGGPNENSGSKVKILGSYIPIGAKTLSLESHSFHVGDEVLVTRVPKQTWIAMLGMDHLENDGDPDDFSWTTTRYTMRYKRTIKKVNGNLVTIDAPIVDPIDQNYATGFVSKYSWSGKITNVGIENIRLISEYSGEDDESHGWNSVVINSVQDGWARNVHAYYFGYSTVNILSNAYRISVLNCKNMYPKSKTTGGRKYSFAVNGQLVLVKDCYANSGRHDFVGHARTAGPNAFVNCTAENQKSDIGPHHRWSTGMLFDNILGDGAMNVQNRMTSGSGHGWAGAQILFWNSAVKSIIIQSPPNHINWSIGNKASSITSRGWYVDVPGYTESNNEHVWPQSLYEQQLKDRTN